MNPRHVELAQMKEPTEQEARLMRAAFIADPDAWKFPRLPYSYSRRLKSIEAGERWINANWPVSKSWIVRLAERMFPKTARAAQ